MSYAARVVPIPETLADGPGKLAQVIIWYDGAATSVQFRWGLRPSEPGGKPISLLRSEDQDISSPCLIVANEFTITSGSGASKRRYRASLRTDAPFFCFAGVWLPATRDWPVAFAGLTVEANPDIAPFKDRHMAVVRPEDWEDWLRGNRPIEELLRPFPLGSFRIVGPSRMGAGGDVFRS